jgi:hypothetical protein
MRNWAVAGVAALLLAGCTGSSVRPTPECMDPASAAGTVCAFYERYLAIRPSGLPTAAQQAELEPWLSDRLERQLDAARVVQAAYRQAHPGEKPPLVDGFLFASLFEGPTDFAVGTASTGNELTRVPVMFSYGTEATWQDTVLLAREGDRYVIDDVELAGAGPFNPAGRLSELLQHAGD